MHKSVQNFCAEECLKHLNRIDDFLNCFLPSGLLFHLFMLEEVKVFPASQKFSPFGAGGKVPLACKGESCSCTVVSGTVCTTCEGMVQYQNICVGCSTTLYLLPARESGGDRKVAASPLPQLHGMLHQVPGTLLHSAWYASPSTRYSAPGNQQAL